MRNIMNERGDKVSVDVYSQGGVFFVKDSIRDTEGFMVEEGFIGRYEGITQAQADRIRSAVRSFQGTAEDVSRIIYDVAFPTLR